MTIDPFIKITIGNPKELHKLFVDREKQTDRGIFLMKIGMNRPQIPIYGV
ncbi:MAG: hypothetical protein AAFN00_05110 [Cyanobacteria bacterium J06558_2]